MTREEKAHSLGQEYFPDESNIWARQIFEAQWVSEACMKMAEWERKRLIEKACEWLGNTIDDDVFINCGSVIKFMPANEFVEYFRKAMEE